MGAGEVKGEEADRPAHRRRPQMRRPRAASPIPSAEPCRPAAKTRRRRRGGLSPCLRPPNYPVNTGSASSLEGFSAAPRTWAAEASAGDWMEAERGKSRQPASVRTRAGSWPQRIHPTAMDIPLRRGLRGQHILQIHPNLDRD
jgi:hypothetical protein